MYIYIYLHKAIIFNTWLYQAVYSTTTIDTIAALVNE